MYITTPKRKDGNTVIRLVESFRKEGKVKTRIVKTIGQSKDPKVIQYYKKMARQLLDEHKKGYTTLSNRIKKIPIDLSRSLKTSHSHSFENWIVSFEV